MMSERNNTTSEEVAQTNLAAGGLISAVRSVGGLFSRIGILIALVLLSIAVSLLSPFFLTVTNLLNVALQASINIIVAIGMTFVITTAGIDLSVGSIVGLAGMVVADILTKGFGMPVGLVGGLLLGLLCGCLNGVLITKLKVTPFIVTLGSMSILRGLALIYHNGRPIYGLLKKDVSFPERSVSCKQR